MTVISHRFAAIVLAADRRIPDPVARAAGVSCKAMAPVDGIPMVIRVIEALRLSETIDAITLCGPPRSVIEKEIELRQLLDAKEIKWLPNRETPSTSAAAALQAVADDKPVLLTTADHALLKPAMVNYFCRQSRHAAVDVAVALASYQNVMTAFPGMRRTATRFQDGPFCACNLFAILNTNGRRAVDFWRQVEHDRKKPLKMLNKLGYWAVLKYLLGRLSLAEGLNRASKLLELRADAIMMPFPEAAVDVDKPSDWHFVTQHAAKMKPR
jgi:CTP:molybdopterin cytidylyltransferase MocA